MDDDQLLPSARVVRQGGAPIAAPPVPMGEHVRRILGPLHARGREALTVVIGLWPLTAIMAVAAALIWAAGHSSYP